MICPYHPARHRHGLMHQNDLGLAFGEFCFQELSDFVKCVDSLVFFFEGFCQALPMRRRLILILSLRDHIFG